MVVPASSPAKTVVEFTALAKERPDKLNYGTGGVGSLTHLSAEAFRYAAGIDYVHVPYKGAPDIVLALLGEQVQVGFPTMGNAVEPARRGRLRALAVTGARRLPVLPAVPTLLEAMPQGFMLEAWLGLVAPAGTPSDIVERLAAILSVARNDPAFRATLEKDGSEVVFNSPTEFAAFMLEDEPRWESLIKRIGVKLE
jgi:tripartite-type tricarboxylate transporter receptor subunit TctC